MEDKIIYKGHITLAKREHEGKLYDVVISKNAAAMLYVDENDFAYLTKQFRPAIQEDVLAVPAETLDKQGLSPLEVMIEGLAEECGIKISKEQVQYVGRIISTDGHDTERVHLYLAHGKGQFVGQRLEDSEKIQVIKIPFNQLFELVINNKIEGSKTGYLVMYEKLRRIGGLK